MAKKTKKTIKKVVKTKPLQKSKQEDIDTGEDLESRALAKHDFDHFEERMGHLDDLEDDDFLNINGEIDEDIY